MKAISMIELTSIARGVVVSDYVGKTAEVELLRAHSVCPGKFIVLFCGNVAAVEASREVGAAMGENYVVHSFTIANVHQDVISAINGTTFDMYKEAIGVMEYFSIASAIQGADDAAKAADVTLTNIRIGFAIGGKSYVTLTGKVSAVEEAVKAGSRRAKEIGMLVETAVIPSPIAELYTTIL